MNLIRDRRKGMILVSAAGIVTNILMAFFALFFYQLLSPSPSGLTGQLLYYFARINIILAAFNLIPLPPLDGSKILMGFASPRLQNALFRLERFGFFIIIMLLFLGVLEPVIHFLEQLILSFISLLLP